MKARGQNKRKKQLAARQAHTQKNYYIFRELREDILHQDIIKYETIK